MKKDEVLSFLENFIHAHMLAEKQNWKDMMEQGFGHIDPTTVKPEFYSVLASYLALLGQEESNRKIFRLQYRPSTSAFALTYL